MASPPTGRNFRAAAPSCLVVLALYFLATARAEPLTVVANGVAYTITLSDPTTLDKIKSSQKDAPWYNDEDLAAAVAEAGQDILGFTNELARRRKLTAGTNGPMFVTGGGATLLSWSIGSGGSVVTLPASLIGADPWIFALFTPDNPFEAWRSFNPVLSSVLWVPQTGLDCRATCANTFMLAVSAFKPTEATPNPPLLCAAIGALLNDPTLTVPGSLADDPYRFFLSEGYTQPIAANASAGRPAEYDPNGCSSYLEGTTPNAQNYLCGCVPPRMSVKGTPQKPWRWVPASTDSCNSGDTPFDGYFAPFICRVRATGLIGHLNSQNCGFPSADEIPDCAFGQKNKQPASRFPAALNMPSAKPDFPDCVYMTRRGVAGSTQDVAGWNSIDKLCVSSSFRYFVYRWAKDGPRPKP